MITHLDLFAGIGGFALALDRVCPSLHEFVEYEPHLQRVIKKNWPQSTIYGDIVDFHPKKEYFLVTGGFPCQDISRANSTKTRGSGINGKRSGLWTEYFRVLEECRPKYCIIENVYDLVSNGLGRVVQDLASIGYDSSWTVIDSQYCGVAQRRRRVYILGVRDGITDGSDIFSCARRVGLGKHIQSIHEKREDETQAHKRKSIGLYAYQRSNDYKLSGVASTIKKCGWSMGGDILVRNGVPRYLMAKEKLRLQGIHPEHTEGCGLDSRQLHTANGMTIPAVEWIIKRMMHYDKTLDV